MSFLEGEEGAMPTLEEVAAFIESWDAGSTSPSDITITTSESENDSSPFSNGDVESAVRELLDGVLEGASFLPKKELQSKETKPTKKKRKKVPGASTRLQRRKRAEILALRALSEQLEGRLEQLKRVHVGYEPPNMSRSGQRQSGATNMSRCSWSAMAATQFQERFKSEVINQRLRTVLMEQMKVNKSLREVLQAQASLGNFNTLFGKQPGPVATHPAPNISCAVIGELEKRVEGMYLNSEAMFQFARAPFISCALHVKREQSRGRVFEITSSTYLPCSVQEASAMFWRDFLAVHQYNDKSYHFLRQRELTSVEKSFTWVLRNGATTREIKGFAFVRKFEEPNRVVLVEADRFLLPTEGLQFRIQRWTVITCSETGSKRGSVVRTLIQIHAEYTDESLPNKQDRQDAEDLVLGVLSTRMQECVQVQQYVFVQNAERIHIATAAAALKCQ